MVASLLLQALKGAHAEILDAQGILDRLKKVGQLTAVFAGELNTAAGLAPYGVRSLRVRSAIAVAGTPAAAAAAAPFGVVLFPSIPYGPKPRHLLDIYVPADVYQQLPQQQQQQQPRHLQQQQQQQQRQQHSNEQANAPVVFFCHGGIWATGDRWHFGPMATRLAQEGVIVVVISYTLYPEVLAGEMAGEALGALLYTINNISRYGGDNNNITVMGHSAGGHLGALALMMLAQHRCQQQQQQQRSSADRSSISTSSSSNTHTQQQQQQQQQTDYLSLPLPKIFLGMSAVYDIALHFEFESQRGVAGISTMARACGGAALFDAVSPAVMLKQAAAAAAAAGHHRLAEALPGQQELMTQIQQQNRQWRQQVQWPERLPQAAAAAAEEEDCRLGPADHGAPVSGDYPTAAAAAAATRRPVAAAEFSTRFAVGSASSTPAQQQQQQQQSGPQLLGEIIPYRSGMIALGGQHKPFSSRQSGLSGSAAAGPPDRSSSSSSQTPKPFSSRQSSLSVTAAAGPPDHSSSSSSRPPNTAAAAGVFDDATVVLARFRVDAAKHLPPFVIINSCADHMVPWHEGSDMLQALLTCGVPAKQLIYDRHLHNDFVLDWKPLVVTGASGSSNGVTAAAAADVAARAKDGLPAFARDLISIVTGQVKLQFCSIGNASAAVEAPLGDTSTMPTAAAAATSVPDVSSRDDSIHLRVPWFAVPRARL